MMIIKVACTSESSDPSFQKNMKRYPIFSVQIIYMYYQIDIMHK